MSTAPRVLQFGIPSLDDLFGMANTDAESTGIATPLDSIQTAPEKFGIQIPQAKGAGKTEGLPTLSLCIIGPDGVGKSGLALHMASRYAADTKGFDTKVFYVSTDLSHPQAASIWEAFRLGEPEQRAIPFVEEKRQGEPTEVTLGHFKYAKVDDLATNTERGIAQYLVAPHPDGTKRQVAFMDLQSSTAGDDWRFINQLAAVLDEPEADEPAHLLIIDAVEGLETLAGERDSFGMNRTRRSRIAQIVRTAARKCHIVFIVEETSTNERLPEEYISDVVVRLREVQVNRYSRRTLEIEKARAQSHARGQHVFTIRDGKGSTTGINQNLDDPRVGNAYFVVHPSLHYLARGVMKFRGEERRTEPKDKVADFGIKYLDDMLRRREKPGTADGSPERGLPCTTVTALIGDEGTQKSRLARAFLGQHFHVYAEDMLAVLRLIQEHRGLANVPPDELAQLKCIKRTIENLFQPEMLLSRAATERRKQVEMDIQEAKEKARSVKGKSLTERELVAIETEQQAKAERDYQAVKNHLRDLLNAFRRSSQEQVIKALANALQSDYVKGGIPEPPQRRVQHERIYREMNIIEKKFAVAAGDRDPVNKCFKDAFNEVRRRIEEDAGAAPDWTLVIEERSAGTNPPVRKWVAEAQYILRRLERLVPSNGVSIYLTTQDQHARRLSEFFATYVTNYKTLWQELHEPTLYEAAHNGLEEFIASRTIVRRLEVHDVGSSMMVHIVRCAVREAQRRIFFGSVPDDTNDRFDESWRVRVVIDDMKTIRDTYPEVREDPLFLSFLLFFLRREGLTTLILDTQAGKPDAVISDRFNTDLRTLADYSLFTWRVRFFGESRIGITTIPPIAHDRPTLIRELKWESSEGDSSLTVDPSFELYSGLEEGTPSLVPLQVLLHAETPAFAEYARHVNQLLEQHFTANLRVPSNALVTVNYGEQFSGNETFKLRQSYDALRDLCHLQRDTRLDFTSVMMVDEFWPLRDGTTRELASTSSGVKRGKHRRFTTVEGLRSQWEYLNAETYDAQTHRDPDIDPYFVFQPHLRSPLSTKQHNQTRFHFFQQAKPGVSELRPITNKEQDEKEPLAPEQNAVDTVPFYWSFGFLLCRERIWNGAANEELPHFTKRRQREQEKEQAKKRLRKNPPTAVASVRRSSGSPEKVTIADVWEALQAASATRGGNPWQDYSKSIHMAEAQKKAARQRDELLSWRVFLEACTVAAQHHAIHDNERVPVFDLALPSAESLSCLVLEVWASEIKKKNSLFAANSSPLRERSWQQCVHPEEHGKNGLIQWLLGVEATQLNDAEQIDRNSTKLVNHFKDGIPLPVDCYAEELFKTLILLEAVFSEVDLEDTSHPFDLRERMASSNAVATRHWYSTASLAGDAFEPTDPLVPLALPGRFTVRGDWFLGVAAGSRSGRLADWTLDLLCSRQANITRLQQGIGLPTRDLMGSENENFRTRVITLDRADVRPEKTTSTSYSAPRPEKRHLTYEELLDLSPYPKESKNEFFWLWRSGLYDYDRHARIWQKWLTRMFVERRSLRTQLGAAWINDFKIYDQLDSNDPTERAEVMQLHSYKRFGQMCKFLVSDLLMASVARPNEV